MPPPTEKPSPLPLASDYAAISNQISLLLSQRNSLLKTLNPHSAITSSSSSSATARRPHVNLDDEEDFLNANRPNEGLGYVPESKAAAGANAASREERMLRGRLLGKRKGVHGGGAAGGSGKKVESDSDEEPGRSGVGKKKRLRREVVEEEKEEEIGPVPEAAKTADSGDGEKEGEVEADVAMKDLDGEDDDGNGAIEPTNKSKKKKNKKKKHKKKQAATES